MERIEILTGEQRRRRYTPQRNHLLNWEILRLNKARLNKGD